jgi:hypothetical protein
MNGGGLKIVALGGEHDGREFVSIESDDDFTRMAPTLWPAHVPVTVPNSRIKWNDDTVFHGEYLYLDPGYETWLRQNGVIKDTED